ncbi:hypothetical protein HWV62_26456 [Athelia sp. TMB]|nr:hypothetical protein HWV62_26456 [Athelia sp. TMB]
MAVDLLGLKRIKNSVIGNPSAKLALAQDDDFIEHLVGSLNDAPNDVRIEAAHVIASISYGSLPALHALLAAAAPHALLRALAALPTPAPGSLLAALARALRALAAAAADAAGPSLWGLRAAPHPPSALARAAAAELFAPDALDVVLPLLAGPPAAAASAAQLLAAAVRTPGQRAAVARWAPPHAVAASPTHARRWESTPAAAGPALPWAAVQLVRLAGARDVKAQEAALGALGALARDSPGVAAVLAREEGVLERAVVLGRGGGRGGKEVQVAACLCATHIVRALPSPGPSAPFAGQVSTQATAVLASVLRLVADPDEDKGVRTRATWVLTFLVTDDPALAQLASERGALPPLAALVRQLTPAPPPAADAMVVDTDTEEPEADPDEEPEAVSRLREAALRALAALCLFDHAPRRALLSPSPLGPTPAPPSPPPDPGATTTAPSTPAAPPPGSLAPALLAALSARHPAVRHAACCLVRVLARGVAPLRTTLVDSGLGGAVLGVLLKRVRGAEGVEGEDGYGDAEAVADGRGPWEERAVVGAALNAVCNCVNEFSPLRGPYLLQGLVGRLVQLLNLRAGAGGEADTEFRLGVLWTLKNLLNRSSVDIKRDTMVRFGWGTLVGLLADADTPVREQAYWVLRNLAEDPAGAALVLAELGRAPLLDALTAGLEAASTDVVLQAAAAFANLANCPPTAPLLAAHAPLARALARVLREGRAARRPAATGTLKLVEGGWRDAGVCSALRDVSAPVPRDTPELGAGGGDGEDREDREVVGLARQAVRVLDGDV